MTIIIICSQMRRQLILCGLRPRRTVFLIYSSTIYVYVYVTSHATSTSCTSLSFFPIPPESHSFSFFYSAGPGSGFLNYFYTKIERKYLSSRNCTRWPTKVMNQKNTHDLPTPLRNVVGTSVVFENRLPLHSLILSPLRLQW